MTVYVFTSINQSHAHIFAWAYSRNSMKRTSQIHVHNWFTYTKRSFIDMIPSKIRARSLDSECSWFPRWEERAMKKNRTVISYIKMIAFVSMKMNSCFIHTLQTRILVCAQVWCLRLHVSFKWGSACIRTHDTYTEQCTRDIYMLVLPNWIQHYWYL